MIYADFWETFPDAVLVEKLRKLKDSKGKEKSSALLWYIYCFMDPENTFMQHLNEKERSAEIIKYYKIDHKDLKSPQFKEAVEWFKVNWLSASRRMLNALRLKMYESIKFIEDKKIEQGDDILYFADMMKAFKDYKTGIDEAEAMFKLEGPTKRKLGGGQLGAADSGDIFDSL